MKIFFALILMSITVCVNANADGWHNTHFEADELREEEAYDANVYSCSIGKFICWSNSDRVRIECNDGIFNSSIRGGVIGVRIGLYKGNELIELIKDVIYCHTLKGNYDQVYIEGKLAKTNVGYKIIHHLKYVGDVRIIVPKYRRSDFDITIPMNPNIKTYIPKEKTQEKTQCDYDYYNTSDYK